MVINVGVMQTTDTLLQSRRCQLCSGRIWHKYNLLSFLCSNRPIDSLAISLLVAWFFVHILLLTDVCTFFYLQTIKQSSHILSHLFHRCPPPVIQAKQLWERKPGVMASNGEPQLPSCPVSWEADAYWWPPTYLDWFCSFTTFPQQTWYSTPTSIWHLRSLRFPWEHKGLPFAISRQEHCVGVHVWSEAAVWNFLSQCDVSFINMIWQQTR